MRALGPIRHYRFRLTSTRGGRDAGFHELIDAFELHARPRRIIPSKKLPTRPPGNRAGMIRERWSQSKDPICATARLPRCTDMAKRGVIAIGEKLPPVLDVGIVNHIMHFRHFGGPLVGGALGK
jgi:hypothetical protein